MRHNHMTKTHRVFNKSRYCGHCGLPLARCRELGGEVWHKIWDGTVEGIAGALRKALRG